MKILFLFCFLSTFCPLDGFKRSSYLTCISPRTLLRASPKLEPNSKVGKNVLIGLIATLTFAGPPNFSIPGHPSFVQEAVADVRAQQKRTYFRFIPKLTTGKNFYKTELKQAIDSEKWDVVSKFFEVYVSKVNKNDPNQIDATDSFVNANIVRPMTVFSGSFAERGSSAKQRALLEAKDEFVSAMSELEGCIKDRKGEGFFAPDIKMPTGSERTQQAKAAWSAGRDAINKYISITNDGLMLELNKLEKI